MKIVSFNVNGIRSAMTKGFVDWLAEEQADFVCLQEIKANIEDIDVKAIEGLGYQTYWFPARKKGYSGVAVFTKQTPEKVNYGNGMEQSDFEGRVLKLDYPEFSIISAYFPSGSSGEERQSYKYQWLDEFYDYINQLKAEGKPLIVCGDYNICHKAIDIHNPVSNKNSSGFLPEERAWMDKWFENKMSDTFRLLHPETKDVYSWWSFRGAARANNKGWRIDYISVSDELKEKVDAASIHPEVRLSDHCPIKAIINI
ncbi:MAG TPA: exodeoxyribonuclease III [Edaphocola sp.]|nr:exodeoxyribonuclease III [Edaphocola sp.]